MTPNDHNRTLTLAHGLIGLLALAGLAAAVVLDVMKFPSLTEALADLPREAYLLPLPLAQLAMAYGLYRRQGWGRLMALVLCALYVLVFPLGTLLAVYTYWFLHTAGARHLYAKPAG